MELNGIDIKYAVGVVLIIVFLIYYVTILWSKIDNLNFKLEKYEKGSKSLDLTENTTKESVTSKKKKSLPEPNFD